MARTLLVRGMLVGIVAGLIAFTFARLYGEPRVDSAIAFEKSMHAPAADSAPAPATATASPAAEASPMVGASMISTAILAKNVTNARF